MRSTSLLLAIGAVLAPAYAQGRTVTTIITSIRTVTQTIATGTTTIIVQAPQPTPETKTILQTITAVETTTEEDVRYVTRSNACEPSTVRITQTAPPETTTITEGGGLVSTSTETEYITITEGGGLVSTSTETQYITVTEDGRGDGPGRTDCVSTTVSTRTSYVRTTVTAQPSEGCGLVSTSTETLTITEGGGLVSTSTVTVTPEPSTETRTVTEGGLVSTSTQTVTLTARPSTETRTITEGGLVSTSTQTVTLTAKPSTETRTVTEGGLVSTSTQTVTVTPAPSVSTETRTVTQVSTQISTVTVTGDGRGITFNARATPVVKR